MRAVLALAVTAAAGDAAAAPSELAWVGAADVLAARTAEAQVRITDQADLGDAHVRETFLWLGAQVGITERLELTLPIEASYMTAVGLEPELALRRYGAELRYRMVDRGKRFVPLLRFAVLDDVVRRNVTRAELDGTFAYTCGRVLAAVDLGVTADAGRGGLRMIVRPSAGAGYEIVDRLRVGAEVHAELDHEDSGLSWVATGPSVAWRANTFWLAATYAVGLSNIGTAPRLVWGGSF